MNPTLLAFATIAAVGVLAVFYGLAQQRVAASNLQARLAEYGAIDPSALGGGEAATPLPPAANLRERLQQLFTPAQKALDERSKKRGKPTLADQLAKADLKLRTSEFFMIQIGAVVVLALIGLLRFGFNIQFLVMGAVGYFLPGFYVRYRQGKRLKAFNNQLGDTLILLSNALKAGYSFAQAVDTVAKNASPPIADEFGRAVREMNLGGTVEEALGNMVRRIESDDLDLMVTAVAIHRTVGGNLAEILDNIAYTIRERVRIKGQIKTLTAQASSSGKLITALPIVLAVFMYFATPTYFKPMTESPVGWVILIIAVFMIFLGNLVMNKVTNIEV